MKTTFTDQDLRDILECLKQQFLHQDELSMYRDIHEHTNESGEFAGDDHVFSMYDRATNQFYFVVSPYDEVTHKAPQHALVFASGVLQRQFDYTSYVNMRTGALDALLMQALGEQDMASKKILLIGAGDIARWSLRFLKAAYPDLTTIEYRNSSGTPNEAFEAFGAEYGVKLHVAGAELGNYSLIACHTASRAPLLTEADREQLAPNAVVTSYLTTGSFEEIADSFWDTSRARVVVSWDKEIANSKDLARAHAAGTLDAAQLITLQGLLDDSHVRGNEQLFFRSAGTPIQNAALIKYLIAS